jgi:general secretion pathway protein A
VQPPASPPDLGEPLYEAFYGLREQPFALSTDPKFMFWSASHRRAYDDLLIGLRRREGVLLLTGETGTGKTTLSRAVIDSLGHRTFSALVLNPYMAGAEVLRVILRDFGLVSREEIRKGALAKADTPQLLDTLETFLRSLVPLDARAVVIIDEAQSLSAEALDQIRMLGAYEEDNQRLLQIVLCGQPGLLNTIKTEPMRALNERITRRTGLLPLLGPEVDAYVRHRLAVAGSTSTITFQHDALALVAEYSRGLPRRVNVLCDRALEEGRVEGTTDITAALVKRAAKSLSGPTASVAAGATAAAAPVSAPAASAAPRIDPNAALSAADHRADVAPMDAVTIEAEPARSRVSVPLVIAVVLFLVAAAAAAYFAWTIVSPDPVVPAPRAAATPSVGLPARALPPPSDDEIRDLLEGRWTFGQGA